jgi:hypothetical protein
MVANNNKLSLDNTCRYKNYDGIVGNNIKFRFGNGKPFVEHPSNEQKKVYQEIYDNAREKKQLAPLTTNKGQGEVGRLLGGGDFTYFGKDGSIWSSDYFNCGLLKPSYPPGTIKTNY